MHSDFLANYISALVTLFVGTFAIGLYLWQKRDNKKFAANAILFELKNAEKAVKQAKDNLKNGILSEELLAMQYESWSKYRHLFVKDFDRDEWDTVTEYYNKCQLFDETVKYNKTFFHKNEEQIRVNKQRVLADYVKLTVDSLPGDDVRKETSINKLLDDTKNFDDLYMARQDQYMYSPQKPINDARIYLEDLKPITTTVIGTKLKKIAKIKP